MDKKRFVSRFSPVAAMASPDVQSLRYRRVGTREFVDIVFTDGVHKPVDVTADGHLMLMMDVLRALM